MQLVTLDVVEAIEAFASIPSALPALIESMLPQLKVGLEVRTMLASDCTSAGRNKRSRGRCLWALLGLVPGLGLTLDALLPQGCEILTSPVQQKMFACLRAPAGARAARTSATSASQIYIVFQPRVLPLQAPATIVAANCAPSLVRHGEATAASLVGGALDLATALLRPASAAQAAAVGGALVPGMLALLAASDDATLLQGAAECARAVLRAGGPAALAYPGATAEARMPWF